MTYCSSGNKLQVTVVACVKAFSQCLPPFIIFDAKTSTWIGKVLGTMYDLRDSGWIDMVERHI